MVSSRQSFPPSSLFSPPLSARRRRRLHCSIVAVSQVRFRQALRTGKSGLDGGVREDVGGKGREGHCALPQEGLKNLSYFSFPLFGARGKNETEGEGSKQGGESALRCEGGEGGRRDRPTTHVIFMLLFPRVIRYPSQSIVGKSLLLLPPSPSPIRG